MIDANLINFPDGYIYQCNGFDCLIMYGSIGSINGYVRIPAGHPATDAFNLNYRVHGGITFYGKLKNYNGYFIGFDTAHAYDWIPIMDLYPNLKEFHGNTVFRSEKFVQHELFNLTKQLAEETNEIIEGEFNFKQIIEGLLKQF